MCDGQVLDAVRALEPLQLVPWGEGRIPRGFSRGTDAAAHIYVKVSPPLVSNMRMVLSMLPERNLLEHGIHAHDVTVSRCCEKRCISCPEATSYRRRMSSLQVRRWGRGARP